MEEWYDKYKKKVYSKKEFRKERYKRILILFLIVGVLFSFYFLDIFEIKTKMQYFANNFNSEPEIKPEKNPAYTSIKDLTNSPYFYSRNAANISGTLEKRVGGYSLNEEGEDWIWLKEDCFESTKKYNYNSQIYIAEGIYIPPKEKEYALDPMIGKEYQPSFRCLVPLSSN